MCGIVGAIAQRDVAPILLEGLRRLEYRGYDSAGLAVIGAEGSFARHRRVGKVAELAQALEAQPLPGHIGVAHTRWATHGVPSEKNAHPHICNGRVAVVHNGIIENHAELREKQLAQGYRFTSDTDTEVIAHQVAHYLDQGQDLLAAVAHATADLRGAYALGVISLDEPERLVAARQGSPLVVGLGIGEHFIASDVQALLPVTQRFIYLENGDLVDLRRDTLAVHDRDLAAVERPVKESQLSVQAADRGPYRHYMLKEIFEQPRAIADTLEGRIIGDHVPDAILGPQAATLLDAVRNVQIIACGTSHHAGLVAKYWFEGIAGVPCQVEVASEFRYRPHVVQPGTLFVTISQSGETADTLAALLDARTQGYLGSIAVCNVAESSLVRESDLALMTHAGPEIGVASTKAFTTQLVALLLLVMVVGRRHRLEATEEARLLRELQALPGRVEEVLALDPAIEAFARHFAQRQNALFLGRGTQYPVALEGALKLKEISYIHAEAYPAGELKHGPLALVDEEMPVIAVAPSGELLEKLKSNLEEVRARGGELLVFADRRAGFASGNGIEVLDVVPVEEATAPILYTVPLQLLAYHTAVMKGTDVDQPRNLAKSVTVE
ncbi:MAG: glutamine--fructose-6-phosphate transaminase (isomerizing) [Chromatiales bacterium]|nr:glutamine--fructose-6-phosphate transaminase (isomerizing) [Chromatiales bacterium]